jgi:hypothetical protein
LIKRRGCQEKTTVKLAKQIQPGLQLELAVGSPGLIEKCCLQMDELQADLSTDKDNQIRDEMYHEDATVIEEAMCVWVCGILFAKRQS